MRKRFVFKGGWRSTAAMLAGLLALLCLAVIGLLRLSQTPAPDVVVVSPTATAPAVVQRPTHTPHIEASLPTATSVPTVVAQAALPDIANTSQAPALLPDNAPPTKEVEQPRPTLAPTKVTQAPKSRPTSPPAPPKSDPNLLPNGVRYGDPRPKLSDRIVRIASPDIKLDTSVYEVYIDRKTNVWQVADYAAGHNYNSANPGEGGNIVLSGHNNWRGEVFRYLEFLKPGNTIQIWTLDGKEYDYRVTDIEKLKEAGVSMAQRLKNAQVMNPTDHEQLTLITCWPYTTYTHRLIVTALPVK